MASFLELSSLGMDTTTSLRIINYIDHGTFGHIYFVSLLDGLGQHEKYMVLKQCQMWGDALIPYDCIRESTIANLLKEEVQSRILVTEQIWVGKEYYFLLMEYLPGTYWDMLNTLHRIQHPSLKHEKQEQLDEKEPGEIDIDEKGEIKTMSSSSIEKNVSEKEVDSKGRPVDQDGNVIDLLRFPAGSIVSFLHSTNKNRTKVLMHYMVGEVDPLHVWNKDKIKAFDEIRESELENILVKEYKIHTKQGFKDFFLHMTKELLECIHALHQYGLMHDDLRPPNIGLQLTNNKISLVLIDFSHVKFLSHSYYALYCVPHQDTMGPELYMKEELIPQAMDIWSVGVTLGDLFFPKEKFLPLTAAKSDNKNDSEELEEAEEDNEITQEEEERLQQIIGLTSSQLKNMMDDGNNDMEIDSEEKKEISTSNSIETHGNDNEEDINEDEEKESVGWAGINQEEIDIFRQLTTDRGLLLWVDDNGNNAEDVEEIEPDLENDEPLQAVEGEDTHPYIVRDGIYFMKEIDPSNLSHFVHHLKKRRDYTNNLPDWLLRFWLQMFIRDPSQRPTSNILLNELNELIRINSTNVSLNNKRKIPSQTKLIASDNNYESHTHLPYDPSQYLLHVPSNWTNYKKNKLECPKNIQRRFLEKDLYTIHSCFKLISEAVGKQDMLWDKRIMLSSIDLFDWVIYSPRFHGITDPQLFKNIFIVCYLLSENSKYILNDYHESYGSREELKTLQISILTHELNGLVDHPQISIWQALQSVVHECYMKRKNEYPVNEYEPEHLQAIPVYTLLQDISFWLAFRFWTTCTQHACYSLERIANKSHDILLSFLLLSKQEIDSIDIKRTSKQEILDSIKMKSFLTDSWVSMMEVEEDETSKYPRIWEHLLPPSEFLNWTNGCLESN